MHLKVFLLVCLVAASSGESGVTGPPVAVQVVALGGDVVLPCTEAPQRNFPTVEWSKSGLEPRNQVLVYRDGYEVLEEKNPEFQYRTSLIYKELKNWNFSLRISKVRLEDAGTYTCKRVWSRERQEASEVQLVVVAVPEPKLRVTAAEGGVVTLQCEVVCGLPEPEITFLDGKGNEIPADEARREPAGGGARTGAGSEAQCFTVRRNVTLQDDTNRVTCRVHQPDINQTRHDHILLPVGNKKSCIPPAAIAVAVTLLLFAAFGLVVFVWRRCCRSADGGKTDERKASDSSEDHQPLVVRVDNTANNTMERLNAEVADLKAQRDKTKDVVERLESEVNEKDETNQKLKAEMADLKAQRDKTKDVVERLESELGEKDETNQKLKAEMANLKSQVCERDNTKDINKKLESELWQKDETNRKRDESNGDLERLKAEVANLKSKLRKRDATEDTIKRLESELRQREETIQRLQNPNPGAAACQSLTFPLSAAISDSPQLVNILQTLQDLPGTRQRRLLSRQASLPATLPGPGEGTVRNRPEPVAGGGRSRLSSLPGPGLLQFKLRRRHSSPDSSLLESPPENGLDQVWLDPPPDPQPDPRPRPQRHPPSVSLSALRPRMASVSEDTEMLIA